MMNINSLVFSKKNAVATAHYNTSVFFDKARRNTQRVDDKNINEERRVVQVNCFHHIMQVSLS